MTIGEAPLGEYGNSSPLNNSFQALYINCYVYTSSHFGNVDEMGIDETANLTKWELTKWEDIAWTSEK